MNCKLEGDMARRITKNILHEFDRNQEIYSMWSQKLQLLVKEVLEAKQIQVHSISGRVKDRGSLERKIENKPNKYYESLADITDVAGVRVITYFADDVDRVANAIKEEFDVDLGASVDKRSQLEPDSFGYLSLHYIVSLNSTRTHLAEYKRQDGLKAEIQIRSVLQHAWAEIEHDLGYKTEGSIPRALRRRFSRLAGLLELGDEEFINVRDQLNDYEKNVSQEIVDTPKLVGIDKLSLKSFLGTVSYIEIESDFLKATNAILTPQLDSEEYGTALEESAEKSLQLFAYTPINTIAELEQQLRRVRNVIPQFAIKWINPDDEERDTVSFAPGISIFYLVLMLLAESGDREKVLNFWISRFKNKEGAEKTTERLFATYSNLMFNK